MNTPLVSILIPNFNYATFLPAAIDSALQQDYPALEILIGDDASTDASDEICKAYANRDTRIRYHRHPQNLGMVANWNWCLRQARGTYIRLLMADDLIVTPTAIRQMSEILNTQPHIAIVTSMRQHIDAKGDPLPQPEPYLDHSGTIPAQHWIQQHLTRKVPEHLNSIGEPSAVLFRKNLAARGFDESLQQFVDLEMWLHLLTQGDLYYMHEPLCAFRKHPEQQTEHNRRRGIHRIEEMEIYARYSPQPFRDRHRYRIMRRMQKEQHKMAHHIRQHLHDELGKMRMTTHAMRYRLNRLQTNITRLRPPRA